MVRFADPVRLKCCAKTIMKGQKGHQVSEASSERTSLRLLHSHIRKMTLPIPSTPV